VRAETHSQPSHVLPAVEPGKLRGLKPKALVARFALGAAISVVAGIVGKALGSRFGGVFLAFPSVLPASLTLLQAREGVRRADRNAIGAVLGGAGLVGFAMIGEAAFGSLHPAVVILLAAAGWVAGAFFLYGVLAFLRPQDCDRTRD
jgi:hypothetical protein